MTSTLLPLLLLYSQVHFATIHTAHYTSPTLMTCSTFYQIISLLSYSYHIHNTFTKYYLIRFVISPTISSNIPIFTLFYSSFSHYLLPTFLTNLTKPSPIQPTYLIPYRKRNPLPSYTHLHSPNSTSLHISPSFLTPYHHPISQPHELYLPYSST